MWEAYGLDDEDLLWSGINFYGGIAGYQKAPCGAVSASAISLGLRYRCSLDDKDKSVKAKQDAGSKTSELVRSFAEEFGSIICLEILGVDLSDPEKARRFFESGEGEKKCHNYVQWVVEKLYELEEK
jgi:C_GCAxxG_C_C family probable redox protein